jgi:hypothetical protein
MAVAANMSVTFRSTLERVIAVAIGLMGVELIVRSVFDVSLAIEAFGRVMH